METVEEVKEIQKQVSHFIYNRNKWGAKYVEVFTKEGSLGVNVQHEFERADCFVTPMDQDEVDLLTKLLNSPKGELRVSDIRMHELVDTTDDGDEYFVYHQGWSEEDKAALEAEYDNTEDGMFFGRREFLESNGYNQDYYEIYLTDVVFEDEIDETSNEPLGQYGFCPFNNDIDGEYIRWINESI